MNKAFVEWALCKKRFEIKDTQRSVLAEAKRAGLCEVHLEIQRGRKKTESMFFACEDCAKKLHDFCVNYSESFMLTLNNEQTRGGVDG